MLLRTTPGRVANLASELVLLRRRALIGTLHSRNFSLASAVQERCFYVKNSYRDMYMHVAQLSEHLRVLVGKMPIFYASSWKIMWIWKSAANTKPHWERKIWKSLEMRSCIDLDRFVESLASIRVYFQSWSLIEISVCLSWKANSQYY